MDDLEQIRERLAGVERNARGQAWAAERPWLASTHVGWEGDLLVVDLHDLGAGLAKQAVKAVMEAAPELRTGAVCFVTGRGRQRIGGGVLGKVVPAALAQACGEQVGWRFRPHGGTRWVLITDPARAPAAARGDLGWGFVLWIGLLVLATAIAVGRCATGG